jgi:hypothetical protein
MAAAHTSTQGSRSQQTRRRLATGCSALCIALILLALSATALIYLRPVVEQPGSGQAIGVEIHATPETPLAQVQSLQATATATKQTTATPGSGKQHDPHATPTTGPTPVPTSQPTATPKPSPPPTATPKPPSPTPTLTPGHGTLTFIDQSERWSSPATLTGCPSGCVFATKSVAASTRESATRSATGRTIQTQLTGNFDIAGRCSNGPGNPCHLTLYVSNICGDGICCPIDQYFSGGEEVNGVPCTVHVSSPTFIPAGALDGQAQRVGPDGTLTVSWSSSAFTGNGGRPYVSQADCNSGLNVVKGLAANWIASTWASASSGNIVARSYSSRESGQSCFPGVGTIASSFTASVSVSISNGLVYNPSGPINAAKAALTSAAPGGSWDWIYTSPACSPTTLSVSGNNVTASCRDSGLVVWTWSASDKAVLAQAVAGQTLQSAQAICNGWAHVAGNCVATSDASNHMPPPSDWQAIVINPQNPPNPFSSSTASANAVRAPTQRAESSTGTLVVGLDVLLALLGLLLLCAGGIGLSARRRRERKAV